MAAVVTSKLQSNSLIVQAYATTVQPMTNLAATIVKYDTILLDTLNQYNETTGVFTASLSANYIFNWSVRSADLIWPIGTIWMSKIVYNNTEAIASEWYGHRWEAQVNGITEEGYSRGSYGIPLAAGDTIDVRVFQNRGGISNTDGSGNKERSNYLSVYRG